MRKIVVVALAAAAALLTAVSPAAADGGRLTGGSTGTYAVPPGMTAAYAVYDRSTGRITVQHNEHLQIRSASVVKLLIAVDYFTTKGPSAPIPAGDLAKLQSMLRLSDDTAASQLWVDNGWEQIVVRMADKMGLEDTDPPANRGIWGYTPMSASDVVKVYRYILERADQRMRDFIMDQLHQATKCAKDGFDQSFGMPTVVPRRPAVKQGWSGYGEIPPRPCTAAAALAANTTGAAKEAAVDLTSPALHTTGTYSSGDRKIMAVLTLQPQGTSWDVSVSRINELTKSVHTAGG